MEPLKAAKPRKRKKPAAAAAHEVKRPVRPGAVRAALEASARAMLLLLGAAAGFPVRYFPIAKGLDESWGFALNYFHAKGLIHGRDVAFTYGPLSYLAIPMDTGSNFGQAIIAQSLSWLCLIAILAWLAFWRRVPLIRLLLLALGMLAARRIFFQFGYAGWDFFLGFLALLLLGCCAITRRWAGFYGAATVLGALLLLIKFSTGVQALAAVFLFACALYLVDKRKSLMAFTIAGAGAPLAFAVCYLAYYPSFAAMLRYLRAGVELSSGYSAAMSLPGATGPLAGAGLLALPYGLLLAVLYRFKQPSFCVAFAGLGPMFLEFRHAFVRQPGHVEIFFTFVPLVWAVVLLATEITRKNRIYLAVIVVLFAVCWYPRTLFSPWSALKQAFSTTASMPSLHVSQLRRSLAQASARNLAEDRLPPALLARIGRESVAVFPWEASYAAANSIDYRPFPVFQTYSAYTAYLDRWNSEFLEDPRTAPRFILVDWKSIDGRHPLLDVPATFLAMFKHYTFEGIYGEHLLLRRKDAPGYQTMRRLETSRLRLGQPFRFPASEHPLIARVFLKPSFAGWVRRLFFRIPELHLIAGNGGRFLAARIPPDVTSGGIPLNFLPLDLAGAQALFERSQVMQPSSAIVIDGAGAGSFQPEAVAEIDEIPEITLNVTKQEYPDFASLRRLEEPYLGRIEQLNGVGAEAYEVPVSGAQGYLTVQGWAIDPGMSGPAAAVYLELDGKLYQASYGSPRQDIAALFHNPAVSPCGFQWTMAAWELGNAPHVLKMKVLTADRANYFESQTVRFRMEARRLSN